MPRSVDIVYASIMISAIVVAAWVRRTIPAAQPPMSARSRAALAFGALTGGVLGAKLPFVLSDLEGAVTGMAWLADGRTITWGLVGGYLGVELAKWLVGVKAKTGDSFAAPVAAGVAVGRLACLYGGCCYGVATESFVGVDFGDGIHRHPTQLYEFGFHAVMAALLVYAARRALFPRQLVKLYILSYLAYRFVTEFIRPEPVVLWGLTFYQCSALVFGALFVVLYAWDARALRRDAAQTRSETHTALAT